MLYWTIAIYCFCFLAGACSAWLLMRSWRRTGIGAFYWSGACFGLLAINNLPAVVQKLMLPEANIFAYRNLVTLAGVAVFLYGFIWEDG